jgi:hypothetical protein
MHGSISVFSSFCPSPDTNWDSIGENSVWRFSLRILWALLTTLRVLKKKKKNSKRSTTLEVKTSSFYWSQQSDVSPTPSIWQAERIFGLGWPDWACYFRGPPLTTGWWDPALCYEPSVNVNNLGCDPLWTSEPWFLVVPINTCVLWWFLSGFWLLR